MATFRHWRGLQAESWKFHGFLIQAPCGFQDRLPRENVDLLRQICGATLGPVRKSRLGNDIVGEETYRLRELDRRCS